MASFLDICGHAIVAIMAIFMIFDKMARPIIAIYFKLLWPFLALFQRMAKMQSSSEDGTRKYANKRMVSKLWPFSLYFQVILAGKWPFQRRHFPCEFRPPPNIFGIRRARGMGLDRVLIQNQTFKFFAPP